jgi:glycosyltransferase involved in cell wall biosynthesis
MRLLGHGSSNGVDADARFNPARANEEDRANLLKILGIDAGTPIVGFVGRIVKDKGVEDLIRAWKRARGSDKAVLLVIGVKEPQDPISDACLEALQEDTSIIPIAWVDSDLMYRYYNIMDFLVLPSRREGFPNTILEAAAMERPTIATRVTGCTDAVKHGVTGLLVPPGDVDALALAMETYLSNPELCTQHGRAGRQRVLRDFRQPVIWEAIYHEYLIQAHEKGFTPRPESSGKPRSLLQGSGQR